MTRDEAKGWLVQTLLDKVREDRFPSPTQLEMIELVIPREMVPDYLEVLFDKVADDNMPSIPMLRRIARLSDSLPAR